MATGLLKIKLLNWIWISQREIIWAAWSIHMSPSNLGLEVIDRKSELQSSRDILLLAMKWCHVLGWVMWQWTVYSLLKAPSWRPARNGTSFSELQRTDCCQHPEWAWKRTLYPRWYWSLSTLEFTYVRPRTENHLHHAQLLTHGHCEMVNLDCVRTLSLWQFICYTAIEN